MQYRLAALGLISLTAWGCQEPAQIVPVAPPGMEVARIPPTTIEGEAQALGEQAPQSAADPAAKPKEAIPPTAPPTAIGEVKTTKGGVKYETLKEGTGPVAHAGQQITIHYTGRLTDGTVFDSSYSRNAPLTRPIGLGELIRGWDEGIPGMKVGERRRLTIPSYLGYGVAGSPPKIPADATLIFDVELLGVK